MLIRSFGTLLCSLIALPLSGCVGDIGGEESVAEQQAPICDGGLHPGPSPTRRLTRAEYNATVRDLIGDTQNPADDFAAEEEALGFNNNAYALVVTPTLAEKYMLAAEGIALRATADVAQLTDCDPYVRPELRDVCVKRFINDFVGRAFRRPLTETEKAEMFAVFVRGTELARSPRQADDTPTPPLAALETGISLVIETALQSPEFLYRVELGQMEGQANADLSVAPGVVRLTSREMASRLSYFLWGSMPDAELFAAADANALSTREEVAAAARRMLQSEKARDAVETFHREWLDYDRIGNVSKDPTLFPEWSSAVGSLMREEARQFIDHVVFDGEGDLATLLAAPYTIADAELAGFYGQSSASEGFGRVDFPAEKRAGLLTMGAMLGYYAHSNQTSPVHRGKIVREAFLCGVIAPPPPDIEFILPMPDPNSTARERFAAHAAGPCATCHKLMDPLGFGFENFDSVGRYRETDNGQPIDASGEVVDTDAAGPFVGVRQLADKLAASEDVKACYTKMWFRFAMGRGETPADACSIEQAGGAFLQSSGNVRELLVALTQTDAFMYRSDAANTEPKTP